MISVVEIEAINPATLQVEVIRVTSGIHFTSNTAHFMPFVSGEFTFDQQIFSSTTLRGSVQVGTGNLEILNVSGILDKYENYVFDGQKLRAWAVEDEKDILPTEPTSTFSILYAQQEWDKTSFILQSRQQDLAIELQPSIFPNEDDVEEFDPLSYLDGDWEEMGKPKPQVWGRCLNVPLSLLNKYHLLFGCNFDRDGTPKPVYQFWNVYNQGIRFEFQENVADIDALLALSVSPGIYAACLSTGMVRLGSVPSGEVTADVSEDSDSNSSVSDLVSRILQSIGWVPNVDYDQSDLDSLKTLCDLPSQYFVNGSDEVLDIITALLESIGAWGVPDNRGVYRFDYLKHSDELPDELDNYISEDNWTKDTIKKLVPGTVNGIPIKSLILKYSRIWKTLSDGEIIESADQATKKFYSQMYRDHKILNEESIHPLASEEEINTLLVAEPEVKLMDSVFHSRTYIYWANESEEDSFVEFPENTDGVTLVSDEKGAPAILSQLISFPEALSTGNFILEIYCIDSNDVNTSVTIEYTGGSVIEGLSTGLNSIEFNPQDSNFIKVSLKTESNDTAEISYARILKPEYLQKLNQLAQSRFKLFSGDMSRYEFELPFNQGMPYTIGSPAGLKSDRWSLSNGKVFQVIGREENWDRDSITLDIWRSE